MSGISTNRTNITVPTDVAQEILQKTQQGSAVMRLARQVKLPGNGLTIPVITSDPQAAWVAESGAKTVSNPGLTSKIMQAYKLAVIVPFSDEFRRDLNSLYEALVSRLPLALAEKFDNTVIGAVEKPGENFDNFALCTAQSLIKTESHSVWGALTGAYTDIADHKGILNGFAISPSAKGILLADVDSTGRPIFVDGVGSDGVARVLGAPTIESRGMYKAGAAPVGSGSGTPAIIGVAGDWTQALYGTVEGVKVTFADQTGLTIGSTQVNLWEHNMFAVRAEIELGFRADTDCFNILTGAVPQA